MTTQNNLEWIGQRVLPRPHTGYTGIHIVRGVATGGLAYIKREGFNHIYPVQIADLERVEDQESESKE